MKQLAMNFLARFQDADVVGTPVGLLADDLEGFTAAVGLAPDQLMALFAVSGDRGRGGPVDYHEHSFASAVCDEHGRLVIADPRFKVWLGGLSPLSSVVKQIQPERPGVSTIAHDRNGRPVALAAACYSIARGWPLTTEVRGRLERNPALFAVIAFQPTGVAWNRAARAFGLTPAEAALIAELGRTGELKSAAAARGIAYDTARKLVASAMTKAGARRQTELVRLTLSVAAGDIALSEDITRVFADLFEVSLRQAAIARLIASGCTREEAAAQLKISGASAKADLKALHLACNISTAADLARIVAEVETLHGLAAACDVEMLGASSSREPLRLIRRSSGSGRIAVADHGPAKGVPVLMFHPTTLGRHMSARFIRALQAAGLRPIAFDRAGFGLTDPAPDTPPVAAIQDVRDLLDALGIERTLALSRGGALPVLSCAAAMPDRIVGGVLLGPDTPAGLDRVNHGLLGQCKQLLFANEWIVEKFARMLSRRTSSEAIAKLVRASVRGSAIDESALEDAGEIHDLVRASRQAAMGMTGFAREVVLTGSDVRPSPLSEAKNWTVLFGEHDPIYCFEDAAAYWRETLPHGKFQPLAGGGRFVHLTHSSTIAAELNRLAGAVQITRDASTIAASN